MSSKPELTGTERDAEIDRLMRTFCDDAFEREIADAVRLAREPGSPRPLPTRVTDAFFGRKRSGRTR